MWVRSANNRVRRRRLLIVRVATALLMASLWLPLAASASQPTPPATSGNTPIRVGVYVSPPFVMTDRSGDYTGLAVELWEKAAQDLGWHYQYVKLPTIHKLVDALQNKDIDVALTNLTVNKSRAKRINFTQPWSRGGLRIMIYDEGRTKTGFWAVIEGLSRSGYLLTYAWIIAVIIAATCLLTIFDRRFDENFPARWRDGIAESFYTVMSVVTSGKPASRKNLFGWLGRIWQGIWLVCGLAVLAFVTSSVTSVMTTLSLTGQINSVADLAGKSVAVREGSTGEAYANLVGLDTQHFDNLDGAVAALQSNKVSAIIGDGPVLEYYQHTNQGSGVAVVGRTFSPENYGFGLQLHSTMTKPLTVELLGLEKGGYLDGLRKKYFGKP